MGNQAFQSVNEGVEGGGPILRMTIYKCKILLLGIGGVGKSTTWFQISKLNNVVDEKLVHNQTLGVRLNLISYLTQSYNILVREKVELSSTSHTAGKMLIQLQSDIINQISDTIFDMHTLTSVINQLTKESAIMTCYRDYPHDFKFVDEIQYFLEKSNLDRILDKKYTPTFEDIISMRLKTTGAHSTNFVVEDCEFEIIDVGGQRNERKKWKRLFDKTHILAYIVSLSDYDEVPFEDETKNSMMDALETFESTVNGEWFNNTEIIVLFNKEDMLKKKMTREDGLKKIFPEYSGGADPEAAKKFIKEKFISKLKNPNRVHTLEGYALSDDSVRKDFEKALSISKDLKEKGLLKRPVEGRRRSRE